MDAIKIGGKEDFVVDVHKKDLISNFCVRVSSSKIVRVHLL